MSADITTFMVSVDGQIKTEKLGKFLIFVT